MALVWSHVDQTNNVRYEVRSAGATLRLYTNGAFHSQFNPNHLFTKGVWDSLSIAALFARQTPDRLLMLGVGGGTCLHQITRMSPQTRCIGVEFDKTHIEVATSFFNLTHPNIEVAHFEASRWLSQHRGKHDVIIDDLFVHGTNDPERPFPLTEKWLTRLNTRITKQGALIQNHLTLQDARTAALALNNRFQCALVFRVPRYENCVLGLYRSRVEARAQRRVFDHWLRSTMPKLQPRLTYSVRQLY